jgi:hypothetical protein
MRPPLESHDTYEAQVTHWARALAAGDVDALGPALAEGSSLRQVRLFVEGNFEKRHQLLKKYLEFVSAALEDLEELLWHYLDEVPLAALDTGFGDADRFLHWLQASAELTPAQEDVVRCQRARFAVEARASKNRSAHVRFQRTRVTTTALVGDEAPLPADLLFFAVGTDVRTALLDGRGQALVRELASFGPWTLEAWAATTTLADRGGLLALCRDLAEMGLVAFGTRRRRREVT